MDGFFFVVLLLKVWDNWVQRWKIGLFRLIWGGSDEIFFWSSVLHLEFWAIFTKSGLNSETRSKLASWPSDKFTFKIFEYFEVFAPVSPKKCSGYASASRDILDKIFKLTKTFQISPKTLKSLKKIFIKCNFFSKSNQQACSDFEKINKN